MISVLRWVRDDPSVAAWDATWKGTPWGMSVSEEVTDRVSHQDRFHCDVAVRVHIESSRIRL